MARRRKAFRPLKRAPEQLEDRCLLSAFVSNGTLFVEGGDTDDLVRIFPQGGDIVVRENSEIYRFNASDVRRITVLAHDGNDRVIISPGITLPTTVRGGDGDDIIRGGSGSDELYGGRGNDFVAGRDGDDWLYGQSGRDRLRGGRGSDTLRGGRHKDDLRGGRDIDRYYYDHRDDVPDHELREEHYHKKGGQVSEAEYKAYMTGPGGLLGKAEYELKKGSGFQKKKFEAEVKWATPGDSFDVYVDGVLVGTIVVGPNGKGKLEYTTHPDSPHDQPFPAGFPTISDGTTVSIGSMSGTLRRVYS